jgi:phosphoglucosamine mutase
LARRLFGTDGVRGVVGKDLTEDLVERLGRAFGFWLGRDGHPPPQILTGRDTRGSGAELEHAVARGIGSAGIDVRLGGVLPTPAVALLDEGGGAVVSASHNPPEYNGVKFFRGGWKLTDAEEDSVEQLLDERPTHEPHLTQADGLDDRYAALVSERFGAPLDGLRLVLDCANGAMYDVAPAVFEKLGAHVATIGNRPDGTNINVGCGATDLALLRRTVRAGDVDFGVAFDGDGDRMLAVDAAGNEVDGDQILAVVALHLGVELVAVTEMTNLGFHRLMEAHGIRVVTTDVGDRYVAEALRREGGVLGGEQSGHLIYLEGHTTGDGLVAALLLARAVVESGRPLAELVAAMPKFPQAKTDVPVRSKEISAELRSRIDELADEGRIVVRPSGTEPVIRVLAEAETARAAADLCARIAALVSRELGS